MKEKNCNMCYLRQVSMPMRSAKSIHDLPSYSNGITKPVMGWSSWNCFRNNIDEEKIIQISDALVKTGLAEKGYCSLNLDDNWHSSMRDENGELQGDLDRFPHGTPNLIKRLNEKGLKVGLYTSNGTLTCEDLPASFGNEERDAYTLAKWGAEFFKYDFCHHHPFTSKAPLVSEISLISKKEPLERIEIKACDATLGGKAKVVKDKKMPCGSYVKGLNKNGGIIIFENVQAKEGDYVLTITTKKAGYYEKFIAVEVNESFQLIIVPSCKKSNNTARVQCKIKLNNKNNIIKLYNPILNKADGYMLQYRNMGKMLQMATRKVAEERNQAEKPIAYSICEWGINRPWEWGRTAGNQWRTTPDIRPRWLWMMMIYDRTVSLYKYADKGHYNDPDMLEVGNGKLNYEQNKSHFNLWCMMSAPLILGNDIRKFIKKDGTVDTDNPVYKIVTNENMISIDQDEASFAAKRVKHGLCVDILAKPLTNGTAICIFNRSGLPKTARYDLKKLLGDTYVGFPDKQSYTLTDMWSEKTCETSSTINVKLPAYGSVVYKVK